MTLHHILTALETLVPRDLQETWDNAGLQCGDPRLEVSRVLTCLDVTEAIVLQAQSLGCQLIVAHHPLLFRGTKSIDPTRDCVSRCLLLAIQHGIAIYAAHTNLDRAPGGMNDTLALTLGLTQVTPLSDCGCWGHLPQPMTPRQLLHHISHHLGDIPLTVNRDALQADPRSAGDPADRLLHTLALCTGSGGEFIPEAEQLGLDAYLTGEIRYHDYIGHPDLLLIQAGHYQTEQHAATLLRDLLLRVCPGLQCYPSDQPDPCAIYLPPSLSEV